MTSGSNNNDVRHEHLICLGSAQLAVVVVGLATVAAVCSVLLQPAWAEFYLHEVTIPRLEQQYGFKVGNVPLKRSEGMFHEWGIVSVNPAGPLAEIGVRAGDVPIAHHGGMGPSGERQELRLSCGVYATRHLAAFGGIIFSTWPRGASKSRDDVAPGCFAGQPDDMSVTVY
jgi:hypothetical protein